MIIQGRERNTAGVVTLCRKEGGGMMHEQRDAQTDLLCGSRMGVRIQALLSSSFAPLGKTITLYEPQFKTRRTIMPFSEELKDTNGLGTSLVDPIVRICLPMQETWVRSLVRELRSHMLRGN